MRPFSSTKREKRNTDFQINNKNSMPKLSHQNSNYRNENDFFEDILKEEISLLKYIWDDLGVTIKYRNEFIKNVKATNELERKDIFEEENKNLENIKELLKDLKKEIVQRENNINSLKKNSYSIENHISEGNAININSIIFQEISDIINDLRYNAITIIGLMSNINNIIFQSEQKWNLNKLKRDYLYDPNYLNKMKDDLNFLKNSILNKFIENNNSEIDPFLTNYIPSPGVINTNKIKIPINKELLNSINKSKYLLIKETVLSNNKEERIKNNFSDFYLNSETNFYTKPYNSIKINNNRKMKISFSPKHKRSTKKLKKNGISFNNNINISREIYFNKKELGIKNYNNIFYKNSPLYQKSIKPKKKKIKIINNSQNKRSILSKFNNNIVIERDEIVSPAYISNLLIDEKNRNNILNNEIIQLKRINIDFKKKYYDIKKLNNNYNEEEKKRISAEKDIDILQIKLKELSRKNQEYLDKIQKLSSGQDDLNNEIFDLNEKIKQLEKKLKNEEEENSKNQQLIKNQIELIEKKDKEILNLQNEIKNLTKLPKIDFYKGNIKEFVNLINNSTPLEKIDESLKRAFLIDESIFTDQYYFKGIFPKIVYIKGEGDNDIKGICSLFYENNDNLNENLSLRINLIYATEDLENNIILMINFIKKKMKYDKLNVYLLYDKIEDKYVPNEEIKNIFQKKLGFNWSCVVNNEKENQRYIKLIYSKNKDKNNFNKNNFFLETYTLLTFQENNIESDDNGIISSNYAKFINQNSIYSLLFENKTLKIDFSNENKKNELKELNKPLGKYNLNEYNWNNLKKEKKTIKNMNINLDDSLFNKIKQNNKNIICDIQKKNLSINFETNFSIIIDEIYYNRVSSDKIKILKESKTNSNFFLIPSKDNTVFFYIGEINNELNNLIIDGEKNVYEQFLEFEFNTQKGLLQFNVDNKKDAYSIPQSMKLEQKAIYIPSFIINTHLYSNNFKETIEDIQISYNDNDKEKKLYLNSVDEFIKIEFIPDDNINNSFSIDSIDDKQKEVIIKDSFIIGIFDNEIVNNDKLPLLQFLYVTKDKFLTKKNFSTEE